MHSDAGPHFGADAARLTTLLLDRVGPGFPLVAPRRAGALRPSVQRGVSPLAAGAVALAACALAAATPANAEPAAGQEAGLRIVLLEGDGRVNIIEGGATVSTRVEVRDPEDRRVAGASVRFQLEEEAPAALNGGLRSVSLTTDALGQAEVTVNPTASGAASLSVTVTFEGRTTTVVIVHTNFATAAEAEAAGVAVDAGGSAGAGAGGGAGSGGGSGTGTIVGIVGGAGAAVGVGVAVAGGGTPAPEPPAVPSTPARPTLTPAHGRLGVSWDEPASDGAITDYDVRYRRSGEAWSYHAGRFPGRRTAITGLTNGTSYEVQVRAGNAVGESPWSASAVGEPAGEAWEYELTLIDVHFDRIEEHDDPAWWRYWVSVTAENTGTRTLGENVSVWVVFHDENGATFGGVQQGIYSVSEWPAGLERTSSGFQYIRTAERPRVAYYRLSVDPDAVRCVGCDRTYRDVPATQGEAPAAAASAAGPVGLSVADAGAAENVDDTIGFTVTLARAAAGTVSVDYATADGSARAGADYVATSGTLTFAPGERSKTIPVAILDDTHDEDEETFTVALSNASGAVIADGHATGRIRNRDPLPRALMARFGRTAAVHVVEQVEERLAAPREAGPDGRFGGRAPRPGMGRGAAPDFLGQAARAADAGWRPAAAAGVVGPGAGRMARGGTGNAMAGGPGLPDVDAGGMPADPAFAFNREMGRGGTLSFWSRGARSSFTGREGALALGGEVRTTMFGADYARGPLVVGLSVANSRGLGDYAGADEGRLASSVTGLYPWLGYKATDRVAVWGVAGRGTGGMMLTPGRAPALEGGLSMAMAAGGTRGELIAGGPGGLGLALEADALWVGTSVDGVDGSAGRLAATEAAVTRLRTGLEGSQEFLLAGRVSLRPSAEVGLRHDGGDAETGAGMDVGAGLVLSDPSTGLAVDLRVRMLVVHQAEGFRERGMAVSFSYDPTPSTPLGLLARVAPSWGGGRATSGSEAPWGPEAMAGPADGGFAPANRLDTEIGYGLPVGSRLVGTPRVGFAASEYGRDYRVGYALTLPGRDTLHLDLGVDARRRESPMPGGPDHVFLGRATLGWQ